ncbi:MAG TPA: molybdenum cofactor guanylyltransferase, partial [Caldimonas sp.]|nr:molybdenum cofactor guanylyltransferase [Caldimonas sp.]
RHLETYAGMGSPVWPDATPDYPGPLAGFLAGLEHCTTPWLVTVPCDSPLFPVDLVAQLVRGIERDDADVAMAATREEGALCLQPVFCLMRATVRDALSRFVASGRRKIDAWTATQRTATVEFDDAHAFVNANTLDELSKLQRPA